LLEDITKIEIPEEILTANEEPTKSDVLEPTKSDIVIKPLNIGSNYAMSSKGFNSASSVTDVTNIDVKNKQIISYKNNE